MASIKSLQTKYGVHLITSGVPTYLVEVENFGLVTGNAIMGANFVKDFFARVADVTGGRVSGYEKAMNGAMLEAVEQMLMSAASMGANTIVCSHLDYCAVGPRMLMSSCYGTAVRLEQRPDTSPPFTQPPAEQKYLHPQPLG